MVQDLLAKYGKLVPLRVDEEATIRNLVTARRKYERGKELVTGELDEPDQLFIVASGRLFASVELPSGARAITRLYFPGDIVGTANMPFERATHSVTTSSPAELFHFPRTKLVEAFTSMPRIAAVFYTFAALETAILNDRLVSIGRTKGLARLAALILEICARQNLLHAPPDGAFHLGLTQQQIGDAIGLTEVQVNRLMRLLVEDGLIARHGHKIEILQRDQLVALGQFTDRYEALDIDWFQEDS